MPDAHALLIPSSIGFAHLGRLLLIADALRQSGHSVAFAYGGPHGDVITALGYPWLPIADITLGERGVFERAVLEHYTPDVIERCMQSELAAFEAFRPQVVVTDFRPTAPISTALAGVPHLAVLNAYATEAFDAARLLAEPAASPLRYRLTQQAIHGFVRWQARRFASDLNRAARRFGVSGRRTLYGYLGGEVNLLADLPGFVPLTRLPRHSFLTGPLIWEGLEQPYPPLPPLRSSQRRVYVTIGNTGSPALIDAAVEAFAGRGEYQVIITTGAYVSPAGGLGENIHAYRFLPGSAVMRQSDVAIHGGGNGTTYQCLANGLPAVVVPSNNDQIIAARLVCWHGVGVPLSLHGLTAGRLARAVEHVLSRETYRTRAGAWQQRMVGVDGAGAAAQVISAAARAAAIHPRGWQHSLRGLMEQPHAAV